MENGSDGGGDGRVEGVWGYWVFTLSVQSEDMASKHMPSCTHAEHKNRPVSLLMGWWRCRCNAG